MDFDKLLGPEIMAKLEAFEAEGHAKNSDSGAIKQGITNAVTAAKMVRCYYKALMIAGFSDTEAYMFAQNYATLLWSATFGQARNG